MGDKKTFLMIDDDTDDQEILSIALDEVDRDLNCIFFSDCESAISYFNNSEAVTPGYVFLDLHLPRISSDQCLQHLKQLKEFDNPSIVIYSSSIPAHWHDRLEQMGVHLFIEKTGSLPALIDKIKGILSSDFVSGG